MTHLVFLFCYFLKKQQQQKNKTKQNKYTANGKEAVTVVKPVEGL